MRGYIAGHGDNGKASEYEHPAATCQASGAEQASSLTGVLDCEAPNRHIGRFEGTFTLATGERVPIGPENLLLRGTQLRSIEWVLGLVVYTGHESKIMQNMSPAMHKVSRLARQTDQQVLFAFATDFALCALAAAVGASLVTASHVAGAEYLWGAGGAPPPPGEAGVLQFFTCVRACLRRLAGASLRGLKAESSAFIHSPCWTGLTSRMPRPLAPIGT